jgi:glucose/arabinose dehydrogenase
VPRRLRQGSIAALAAVAFAFPADAVAAPEVLDPNLAVRTAASGLVTPASIAFLGANDMLVLEKDTGKVQRVVNGAIQSTVLDLAVNRASERGLLGIALHPNFPVNPGIYLYWSCTAPPPPASNPFFPTQQRCSLTPETGADTGDILAVPLLGNRVDRFVWTGSSLVFQRNLIMLRSFQHDGAPTPPGQGDGAQPARGNHDGGVIHFGPDGKLYVQVGDLGRRGQLQNLRNGPTPPTADDQFGGPEPDNAHLSGVILRLNDDGSAPVDNPFFRTGTTMPGEVGDNIAKIFAYGIRNSFGFAFDPVSGMLWDEQNGDDSFTEINLVEPGANLGWVQLMGPLARIGQFKEIETSPQFFGLQQLRWPPTNIADSPGEALSRLFMLPGARYSDPEFSWKFENAPAGVGFQKGRALGSQYENDLFVGAARVNLEGGQIWHFNLTGNRRKIAVEDPRLEDRVADNTAKFEITESETLLFGRNFGIGTDIETGPNGNLFVVSLSDGAIYEIFRRR